MDTKDKGKISTRYRKYLPIGTVVLLKDANKKLMITGFCPTIIKDGKPLMFDYAAVVYPEGTVSTNQFLVFNHEQIEQLFHIGYYKSDEEKNFKAKLLKDIKNYKNKNK